MQARARDNTLRRNVGAGLSGGGAYARYAYSNADSVRLRRIETAYDVCLRDATVITH